MTATLMAHIRRLSTDGAVLYIRISTSDISRLGLEHGRALELDLGRVRITGILKTSGGSPWLGPTLGGSNGAITSALRGAGFEHGMDVSASIAPIQMPGSGNPATSAGPLSAKSVPVFKTFSSKISSSDAIGAIREYNRAHYRGKLNTALDREAYDRFRHGLARDLEELTDQITFVGEQYGGAQRRFLPHGIRAEAAVIARNLLNVLDRWIKLVTDAQPLAKTIPDETTIDFLFSPFAGSKRWPVWASKTLHFIRPDVFPILDSNAKKPLGLANLGGSPREYRQFCLRFRDVLVTSRDSLEAARAEDAGESPSDLKLLDKILFQLGMKMN
ncbi:MAG TPA: hypothetical protein VJQ59_03110 [Candidatus Sulfotelmatobacter sp.]|nr:hypothetical protein [Candidatus Sulfotelmatobacter sp.]